MGKEDHCRQGYRNAWQALAQAVRSDPEDLMARRQLARFYDEAGLPLALDEWRALVRLNPADDEDRLGLNLCISRLGALPARRNAEEVDRLEEMARGDARRIPATLALIQDAIRSGRPSPMEAVAEVVLPPERHAGLLESWLVPDRGVWDLVCHMQAEPRPDAADAVQLAEWMCRRGLAPEALGWLDGLSPWLRATRAVRSARVTCLVQMKDWRGAAAAVRAGAWGDIPGDALDLAVEAHTLREESQPDQAGDAWDRALDAAARSRDGLKILLLFASDLQWQAEAEAALWRMAKTTPSDPANWERLAAMAAAEGSTQKFLEVYQAWVHSWPGSPAAQGGVAWLAALLDRSAEGVTEDFNASNAGFVAANALRLHRSGRGNEGLALLASLPPASREDIRPSLVRGLLLSDLGRREESERVLARIPESQLLPEECALLEGAHAKNGGGKSS
jgi:tetratricopeptide (TPR) repeat protein